MLLIKRIIEFLCHKLTLYEWNRGVVDAIGDDDGVALMVEGDADGINGRYANKYVFVFKFSDGQIVSLREYTSDLLVETRLYKQKIVADK